MEQYRDGNTGNARTSTENPSALVIPDAALPQSIQTADVQAMANEIEALRRQVALLQRELVDARAAVQASETSHLGHTLLVYLLDVLCTLFRPQRGQTLVVDMAGGGPRESKDSYGGVGPLQMVLERPGLSRAIGGTASRAITHYEAVMWLPIMHGSNVAVILCFRRAATDPFSLEDEQLGEVLGPLAISALQTNHRTFDLHDNHGALLSLENSLGSCIRMAGGRIAAMANDCERLAHIMGLNGVDRSHTRGAAILHDIGTVDLAEELLHKQGPLNAEEVTQIREHTVFGAAILRQVPGMEPIIPLIVHHHERWDGAGYPSSLAGSSIPIGARIIAVVDAFYAMTSPRSYRPARPTGDALADLERNAGGQFDPAIVREFLRLMRQTA